QHEGEMTIHLNNAESWKVTLVDTGLDTMTGGRIKRIQKYVNNERFFLTYGDGVSNVDINALLQTHIEKKAAVTLTAVPLEARFGMLDIDQQGNITAFKEKLHSQTEWINSGFFVCEPEIFNYLEDDKTIWEKKPLERLSDEGKLFAHQHRGFWQPMDTLREKLLLEDLYASGNAAWKVWP
ncbi:MAG: sugar phosphate nucleotidyltransferase, partial [Bacillota bacterium]|nr:sugar phosphate nucleotidyltransferase [Bacillota bacterium]